MPGITPAVSTTLNAFRTTTMPDDARLDALQKKILASPGLIPGKEEEARTQLQKVIAPEPAAEKNLSEYVKIYLPDSASRTPDTEKLCCARAAFYALSHCYESDKTDLFSRLTYCITFYDTLMHAEFRADGTVLAGYDAVLGRTRNEAGQPGGLDLSGINLIGADLIGADLRGADLRFANLSGAIMMYADLSGANMSGTLMERACMQWAQMEKANMRGAHMKEASLRRANLSEAHLNGADLSGANLSGVSLNKAVLRVTHLNGANLSFAGLTWADLGWADLNGADLSSADLSFANLNNALLNNATLFKADLSGTILEKVKLTEGRLPLPEDTLVS